jgi:uroporphyrinogen III methyltransferase/synthase
VKPGKVYLVGAGPGDPRLLTLRAVELLRAADVIAYDELISDAVLAEHCAGAELIAVGHRAGAPSYAIHPEVIAQAKAGRTVVRLKCGDPLVFGRGGEEAEALRHEGIAYELVPGISSALGAASAAGIPLTHRGLASHVSFVTGHAPERPLREGTVVLFMASQKLRENLDRLIANGRDPSTPAALIARATTARQEVIVSTLGALQPLGDAPALAVIGDVCNLRETIAWWEQRPLAGRRILVARARPGASELAAKLRGLGAEVIEAPQVSVEPPSSFVALDEALGRALELDATVFGCAAGVDATLARLTTTGRDVRRTLPRAIVAIGKQADERLRAAGILPALAVPGACREAVGAHAGLLRSGRLLLITGEEGRPSLLAELTALGARVETAPAYRTRRDFPRVQRESFDLVVVPSSSAAQALYGSEFGGGLIDVPALAMGPNAQAAARRLGVRDVRSTDRDTLDAAVARAKEWLAA